MEFFRLDAVLLGPQLSGFTVSEMVTLTVFQLYAVLIFLGEYLLFYLWVSNFYVIGCAC